ncbi:MAG: HAD family hydrolase [Candidatus Acidiferrales bacterium]
MPQIFRPASSPTSDLRAVIFDFGEVLCLPPDPEIMGRLARAFHLSPERFLERYHPSRRPYDRGDITPHEYWKNFAAGAGVSIEDALIDTLQDWDHQMWSRIDPQMIDWQARLHGAGYRTAILSNMQRDMSEYVRGNFEWVRRFDCLIFSGEVRLAKPEPKIYEHTIRCLGVKHSEALFVDDREENLQAASALGITGIRVQSIAQLRNDLAEIGFPVLPSLPAREMAR